MKAALRAYPGNAEVWAAARLIERYWNARRPDHGVDTKSYAGLLHRLASRRTRGGGVIVVRVEGVVRGVIGWQASEEDPQLARIDALCVEPGAWENGAFEALLSRADAELARQGHRRVAIWVHPGSPSEGALRGHGFSDREQTRALELPGGAEAIEARLFEAEVAARPFGPELLRLALPRLAAGVALLGPVALLGAGKNGLAFVVGALGLALGALPLSLAEVLARRASSPARVCGAAMGLGTLLLGAVWAIHVWALSRGASSWVEVSAAITNPELWLVGALWAPAWSVAGALATTTLRGYFEPLAAVVWGTLAGALPAGLLALLAFGGTGDVIAILFGSVVCVLPALAGFGAAIGVVLLVVDALVARVGSAVDLAPA